MAEKFILQKEMDENIEENHDYVYIEESMNSFHQYDFQASNLIDVFLSFDNSDIKNFNYLGNESNGLKELTFQDCYFEKNDSLNYTSDIDFIIRGGPKIYEINIQYINSSLLEEDKYEIPAYMYFHNLNVDNFKIFDESHGDLYFKPLTKQISFNYLHFNSFHFCKYFLIDNIRIETLHIENINQSFEVFELRNLEIGELIIENSNLGDSIFNSIIIEKITIKNSSLQNCIFNGIEFRTYILGNSINKNFNNKNYEYEISITQLKDNYRQLKYVMDKNGNHTEANKFFAKEMFYYSKILGTENSNFFTLFRSNFYGTDSEKIGEKFSLIISEIISDYGNNLLRVLFSGGLYLFISYALLFLTNSIQIKFFESFSDGFFSLFSDQFSDIFVFFLLSFITIWKSKFLENKLQKVEESKNFERNIIFILFSTFIGLSFINIGDFEGVNSFIFLLNPLSGLNQEILNELVWTEKIGLLFHKIIFATFIYHFIITLRRTTKR